MRIGERVNAEFWSERRTGMSDMDAACLIRELQEYNRAGRMKTPQMDGCDTIFGCALDHALRALWSGQGRRWRMCVSPGIPTGVSQYVWVPIDRKRCACP